MRALRWALGILATVLVVAILAAWLIPPMLDWTRYRGEIASLASDTLGRSVRIDGPISLTLLPQPVLTAARVSVDEGEAAISVKVLRLRVALGPLLRGKVVARDLVMRDFDMVVPWPLARPADTVYRPAWLAATTARIEHGRVAIGDLAFTDIDADLASGTTTGGYAASGTAQFSGRPWRVSMRMSQPGGDGSVGLDVALDGQGPVQGVGATLSGQIAGDGTLGGLASARGPDLSALLPAPAVPFKAEGRLTIAAGLAAADDLAVEIGGSPAHGAVALRVSPRLRLDVALTASRLDLDAWMPMVLGGQGVPIPTGIDLSAEAAQLAGGSLRRLRGAFDIDRDGVAVRDLSAILPGQAAVTLTGAISHSASGPHFEGEATLVAPSLRATLDWLEKAGYGAFSALPARALRTARLNGHATLDRGVMSLAALSGTVDGAAVEGALAVRAGKRLGVSATLRVDDLDLDRWLPATLPTLSAWPGAATALDADLTLDAAKARARGVEITNFALDARLDGGQLTLRRLAGKARQAQFVVSGTIVDGGRIAEGKLDLRARQADALADWLPEIVTRRAAPLLRAPLVVQAQASGAPDALALRIAADLGDLRLEAQPTLDLPSARWSGPMTLRHPGAPRLAEMLGLGGAPAWLGDGSLALVARVGGETGRLSAEEFDVTAGALHASGRLDLGLSGAEPHLMGRVSAETLPLPLPYARSPDPLPLDWLSGWTASVGVRVGRLLVGASPVAETLAGDATLAGRTLRIDRLTGSVGGGALTGAISLNAAGPVPSVSATLGLASATVTGPIFDTPIDLVAGALDGSLTATATGHSPVALLATLQGDAAATIRGGRLAGFDLSRLGANLPGDEVAAALAGGVTPFEILTVAARAEQGGLRLDTARLESASADAAASGTVDVSGASANLRLAIRPHVPDAPEIGLRLTGPLDAMRRTPELADVTKWRLARAQAANGTPP